MLNSFLSHLLFGTASSNDNLQQQDSIQQQQPEIQQQQQKQDNLTQSAIKNLNEFTDVRNDIDWVIIDPSDNDEVKKHLKRKLNSMVKSMQMSEYGLTNLFDNCNNSQQPNKYANCGASDGATMSGDDSMEDRSLNTTQGNENDDDDDDEESEKPMVVVIQEPVVQEQQQQQQQQQDNWLITPLPSLVSLQTSQKSINENAPLENLLIEHPSMSVFITQDEIDESEEATTIADSSFALIDKNENEVVQSTQQIEVNNVETKIKQAKKNKKKAAKKQQQQQPAAVVVEPVQQQVQQVSNKENEPRRVSAAAAAAVASSTKQTSNKLINSSQFFVKDRCSSTKLQDKCKFYVKNVNIKQRKCHNLQQPQYLSIVNIRH